MFWMFLVMGLMGGIFSSSAPSWAQEPPPRIELNLQGFSASEQCGQCHKQLYEDWRHSLHADSSGNAVFHSAYLQVYFEQGERARAACLSCHAPVAYFNNDPKLTQPISREGVSCDFCHSIAEALPGTPDGPQFRFEFGGIKQGPLTGVDSSAHKTRTNGLYRQSRFCKGCHEQTSPNGIAMIATYSEWEASPYFDRGITCQKCHMEPVSGKTVAPEVKKTLGNRISNHDIAAGHSLSKRRKALDIKIAGLQTFKNRITVQVDLTNTGAGHKMPTGLPVKKIILEVTVEDVESGRRQVQQQVYQKKVTDAAGRPVKSLVDLMLGKGMKVASDNRIAPLETRRETFTFFADRSEEQVVSAAVYYSYTPEILQPAPIHIKLNEVKRRVR